MLTYDPAPKPPPLPPAGTQFTCFTSTEVQILTAACPRTPGPSCARLQDPLLEGQDSAESRAREIPARKRLRQGPRRTQTSSGS